MHGHFVELNVCVLRHGKKLSISDECVVGHCAHHGGVLGARLSRQLPESTTLPNSHR